MKRNLMQELMRWKGRKPRKPLILRGARQVGKTYALKMFGESAFPRYHYFNFEEDERLGSYQGYVAENFVAQELRAAGLASLYAWQGRTSEIEFVIESETGVIPWEVKSGRVTQSKSLGVYEQKFHPPGSYVLSARNMAHSNTRHYVPVYAAGSLARKILFSSSSENKTAAPIRAKAQN